jgi:hypothetical protein
MHADQLIRSGGNLMDGEADAAMLGILMPLDWPQGYGTVTVASCYMHCTALCDTLTSPTGASFPPFCRSGATAHTQRSVALCCASCQPVVSTYTRPWQHAAPLPACCPPCRAGLSPAPQAAC